MKERIILLLDMDAFFPAIEQRENPRFRGLPVVVGADPKQGKGRGVVSSASYEARKYGIRSAMPISQAYKLCAQAVFLPVDMELYQKVSERIMDIVREMVQSYSPNHRTVPLEQVSLDEAYVDLSLFSAIAQNKTQLDCWKAAETFAKKLKTEIFERERLACTIGIGPNKMLAKIACEKAKPHVRHSVSNISASSILAVKPKDMQAFLDPLSVRDIPGVGPKTVFSLAKLSCRQLSLAKELRVKDIRKVSRAELRDILGKHGEILYERVRGIDKNEVVAEEQVKSIGKEHTFERDTRDGEKIFSVFRELICEVAGELKEQNFSFKTITVVCRFAGFETHTKQKTLKTSSQDQKTFEKEAMRLLLKFLVENPKPVRLVGVRSRVAQAERR